MLQIKDLKKQYFTLDGIITALDGVTLEIENGDFVAIVGSSGSGKTTLLNMIGGLDIPDSGSIILNQINITKLSQEKQAKLRRTSIGFIYQFYNLIPELNVTENITLPAELDGKVINFKKVNEIIAKVGLTGREKAMPSSMSGGEQQRVAIARAIFNQPSLLLADEPTGNLDKYNGEEIMGLISELNQKYNVTVLMVTHSDWVATQAKRIITIEKGKISSDRRLKNVSDN